MGAANPTTPVNYLDALKGQRSRGLVSQAEYASAIQGTVRDQRSTIARFGQRGDGTRGYEDLPPDLADMAMRNAATARVARARGGSGARSLAGTALGAAFNPTTPIGRTTFFGDF